MTESVFQYPGGKARIASWIADLLPTPDSFNVFVDVFGGSGSVFLEVMRRCEKNGKKTLFVFNDLDCFDKSTEILTESGWKSIKEVKVGDLVLSLNLSTGEAAYKPVTATIAKDYAGTMYCCQKTVDFFITPTHKLVVKETHNNNWKLETISYLVKKPNKNTHKTTPPGQQVGFAVKRDFVWRGEELAFYKVPAITYARGKGIHSKQPLLIKMEDWLEFLGWFVAEGHLRRGPHGHINTISIAQSTKHATYRQEIADLLKRMNLSFTIQEEGFSVYNKQIALHLYDICYGEEEEKKEPNKAIPAFLQKLSPRLITLFLESYWKGDGYLQKNGTKCDRHYVTTSKQLADDLQVLLAKVGVVTSICKKKPHQSKIGNRIINGKHSVFIIRELRHRTAWCRRRDIKEVFFKGRIYCVNVEPHHTIYVRRNNKPYWSGNSDITNFFRVLRDPKLRQKLQEALTWTPYARQEYLACLDAPPTGDPVEKARRFFILRQQSYGGHAHSKGQWQYHLEAGWQKSGPQRWESSRMKLERFGSLFQKVQVECLDFADLIRRYDRQGVLHYIDPPYYPDTRQDNHLYRLEMSKERHQELTEILKGIKGMAALSGYRCPEYDTWYASWERHDLEVHCHLSSYGSVRHFREETRSRRIESLWLNPAAVRAGKGKPEQLALFDGWEEAAR